MPTKGSKSTTTRKTASKPGTSKSASKARMDKMMNETKEEAVAPAGGPAVTAGDITLEGGKLDFNTLADILASLEESYPNLQGATKTKIVEHFAEALEGEQGFDHEQFRLRASL